MNNPNSNYDDGKQGGGKLLRHAGALRPLALAAVLALSACAGLPPADPTPQLNQPEAGAFVTAPVAGQWPGNQWWSDFHDEQLGSLIEQALHNSPSMAVAQARIGQANAQAGIASANTGARLSASADVTRERYSANYIYPPPIGGSTLNSSDLGLNFSYDFDFWGRNRAQIGAALGQVAAAQAESAGAASTLSAAVANTYYQWQLVNARLALQDDVQTQRGRLIELEAPRVKSGLSAGQLVAPLQADAAQPRQVRVQLETQRDQLYYQLKSLVGGKDFPEHLEARPLPNADIGVPTNLPLELVARRADVAASRDRVKAALHGVDASRAAFYPDVNISALIGFSSFGLSNALKSSSANYGVTPAISLPIFDAGRLRAGLDSSRADVTLAIAQYDQAVQTAVSDVNDAFVQLQGAQREQGSLAQQIAARQRDLASAQRRQQAGLADGRDVVRDRLVILALDDQELARRQHAVSARIALIKALGGGYQDPAANDSLSKK
jgi:multidrug efflux system outer membrane protein